MPEGKTQPTNETTVGTEAANGANPVSPADPAATAVAQAQQPEGGEAAPKVSPSSLTADEIQKQEQRKKELQKLNLGWRRVLRMYIVPIVALSVFFATLLFMIIPGIQRLFSDLDVISLQGEQLDDMNIQLAQLQSLLTNSQSLNSDLAIINSIVPTGLTAVVDFQQRVVDLAEANGLTVGETSTAEQILNLEQTGGNVASLGTIEIPSTFSIAGDFASIKAFIEDIQSLDDFVIIGEMALKTSSDSNLTTTTDIASQGWSLTLTLVKYQFQSVEQQASLADIYRQVPPTTGLDEDILEFVRSKFN